MTSKVSKLANYAVGILPKKDRYDENISLFRLNLRGKTNEYKEYEKKIEKREIEKHRKINENSIYDYVCACVRKIERKKWK